LPLYERALALRERVLGDEHPDTAMSLNNLALLFEAQGCYERILPLYERAFRIYQDRLGPQHPNTLIVERNLTGLRRSIACAERRPGIGAVLRRLWQAIWR
jgi:tetratricopeptide (TPR) repeat protein